MTEEFRYAFRAAGWIPTGDIGYRMRLTQRDRAGLPDAELMKLGAEAARARNLSNGYVAVGVWTNIDHYVAPPNLQLTRPGPLDDSIEDKAEYALQSVLRRHPDDSLTFVDAAAWAAEGILWDLSDRNGFELLDGGINEDVRKELHLVMAAIIRRALSPRDGNGSPA